MPDFPIVDAHVHLYDPATVAYGWMVENPKLNTPHLPEHFIAAHGGVEVEALVFVEVNPDPGAHLLEAETITGYARQESRIKALVANLPLHDASYQQNDLHTLLELPLVRGIRTLIQGHEHEPGWALEEPFVNNVRALAEHELIFELCLTHPQLADTIKLVRRCPEVRFMLDHIAKPGIRAGLKEPWYAELRTLAAEPNVWCKLSGVVTEADHTHWTDNEVLPYMQHTLDCFGTERTLFGSDWPVATLATDYARWVALVDRALAGASENEQRRLYRDNAIEFYRLELD